MKKIRIAQIGANTNSHSGSIFNSLKKQSDVFELVGYVLPENEKERIPERVNDYKGYKELTLKEVLEDPTIDAVTIETDEIYLTKYALLAAKAGKHIHMEKPGGTNLTEFEELINEMKKSGKAFSLGYMYRHNPFIKEAIEKAKSGKLGKIISVEAQMNCYHHEKVRSWIEKLPGGMMFFLGCHLVDLIYQIQGKPKKIIPMNKRSNLNDIKGKDFGFAIFEYENGISFAKTTAVELGGFERRQLVINGSEGTIELRPLEWYAPGSTDLQTKRRFTDSKDWYAKGEIDMSEPVDRYDNMIAAFARYIKGEEKNPYTLDYELELYKLVLEASEIKY